MRKHLLIFLLSCFVLNAFSVKTPKTIDDAVRYFEKKWKKKDLEIYKKLPEDDALSEMDNVAGVWIRNEWIRFPKDTALRHYFHEMGITHADDMSDIILTCVHRKLNNEPFDIPAQVKRCKDYWTPVRECEERAAMYAINNYDRFNAGDSITIFLYMENLAGHNGITIPCPASEEWGFDYKKDIIVKGFVNEKYHLYGDPFFKIQILSISDTEARLFYKPVKIGDIVEFPIKNLLVKQPPLRKKFKY